MADDRTLAILNAVYTTRYATAEMIHALVREDDFGMKAVYKRLQSLVLRQFLRKQRLYDAAWVGTDGVPPFIYRLGPNAVPQLAANEVADAFDLWTMVRNNWVAPSHQTHELLGARFHAMLLLAERTNPNAFHLEEYRQGRSEGLKLKVDTSKGIVKFEPDGFVRLRVGDKLIGYCLEYDTGDTNPEKLMAKFPRYHDHRAGLREKYRRAEFEKAFGVTNYQLIVIGTATRIANAASRLRTMGYTEDYTGFRFLVSAPQKKKQEDWINLNDPECGLRPILSDLATPKEPTHLLVPAVEYADSLSSSNV
jgi:hypothetical protein